MSDSRLLIRAKRFQPLTLHEMMQDLRIDDIAWLSTDSNCRINRNETIKRRRLAEDFVFWLFNDYLIPLLKVSQIRGLWSKKLKSS